MTSSKELLAGNALPILGKIPRQVFVAYPYRLYDKQDYRRPFQAVGRAFKVNFIFADEKISDLHILDKIRGYIRQSAFGIYDITGWNPNVTLELGLAIGLGEKAFIAFDPTKTELKDVPSDIQGMDRLQYQSFSSLEAQIERLVAQELPIPRRESAQSELDQLRHEVIKVIEDSGSDGIGVSSIATLVGVSVELARVIVRPMVGKIVGVKGKKKGTRYVLVDRPVAKRPVGRPRKAPI